MSRRNTRLVIFGAGLGGCRLWTRLAAQPSLTIVAFVDNDPAKQGSALFGIPVRRGDELGTLEYDLVVIASVHHEEIATQLLAAGIDRDRLLNCGSAEAILGALRDRGLCEEVEGLPRQPRARVAIFGASGGGILAWRTLTAGDSVEPVAFLDSDPRRRQSPLLGLPVLEPAAFDLASVDGVVIGSMHFEPIKSQLVRCGVPPARVYSLASLTGRAESL